MRPSLLIKRGLYRSGLMLWLLAASLLPAGARADDNKEYLVKATFIYNFVKFVEWPDGRAIANQSNIDICVLGDSPMAQTGAIFKQASTPRLSLTLMQVKSGADAASHCHVVFIGADQTGQLAALKGHPVLTVSDADDFAEHGGMMGFVMEDNKIKLVVNLQAASAAGLRIDAQLLEIALKVIK